MKKTMREFMPLYSHYDRTGISRHLEKMAAQGWMLEKLGAYSWRYRRTEPRQLKFSVTYFPTASQFDPSPSEGLETFRDLCAAAGWVLAADTAQVQIFYNENEHAVPIETDAAAEYDNIRRSMRRSVLPSHWALLAMSLFQIAFGFWRIWDDPVGQLSNIYTFSSGLCWCPMLLLVSAELIHFYRWQRQAKKAVEAGEPLPELRSSRCLSAFVIILAALAILLTFGTAFATSRMMSVILVLMVLYMVLMFSLSFLAQKGMKRLGSSAAVNRAITFGIIIVMVFGMMAGLVALVFALNDIPWFSDNPAAETYEYKGTTWEVYDNDIPLRIEDLIETDYTGWSTHLTVNSSPLLTHIEATQHPRMDALEQPDLDYEIVIVKADALYNLCRDDYIRWVERWNAEIPGEFLEAHREEYRPVDLPAWGTAEVYQRYNGGEPWNQYLVCWPDRIAEIHFPQDWEITPKQLSIAAEKLRTAS